MNKIIQMKEDQGLPDSFKATFIYHDKSTEVFDLVYIGLHDQVYHMHTAQDIFCWVPKDAVKKIVFDKNFSTIQAKRAEIMEKSKEEK